MRSAVTRLPGEGEEITGYFGRSFVIKAHAPETTTRKHKAESEPR